MNKFYALIAVTAMSVSAYATTPVPPAPEGKPASKSAEVSKKDLYQARAEKIRAKRMAELSETLNLTSEQVDQLNALHKERMDFIGGYADRIQAVFTPEQLATLKAMNGGKPMPKGHKKGRNSDKSAKGKGSQELTPEEKKQRFRDNIGKR